MADTVFAIVVDGEVAGTLVYSDQSAVADIAERHIAALRSPHTIVEAPSIEVKPGWTFDGTEFLPPVQ